MSGSANNAGHSVGAHGGRAGSGPSWTSDVLELGDAEHTSIANQDSALLTFMED